MRKDTDKDYLDVHPSILRRDDVEKAAADEPELPGQMPDEMWAEISGDRDATEESFRICVRLTKAGILNRIKDLNK